MVPRYKTVCVVKPVAMKEVLAEIGVVAFELQLRWVRGFCCCAFAKINTDDSVCSCGLALSMGQAAAGIESFEESWTNYRIRNFRV